MSRRVLRIGVGLALTFVGAFFVAQSAGMVNGGFVVGAPVLLVGAWIALGGVEG